MISRLSRPSRNQLTFLSEKGAVYPLTLAVSLLAFYLFTQATAVYLSEYRFLTEIRDYYNQRSERLLAEFQYLSDEEEALLPYNGENGETEMMGE